MALDTVPVSIAQRHKLLFTTKTSAVELRRLGDLYREKGLLHDALEFYRAAAADDALQGLADSAVAEGDLVLYTNACRALAFEPERAQLEALANSAKLLGKECTAQKVELFLAK